MPRLQRIDHANETFLMAMKACDRKNICWHNRQVIRKRYKKYTWNWLDNRYENRGNSNIALFKNWLHSILYQIIYKTQYDYFQREIWVQINYRGRKMNW